MKKRIYIAGAHSRGTTMGYYLQYLDPSLEIVAYLFDNEEENPSNVNGIPVIKINHESVLETECPVYIGTRGINQANITHTLLQCGMKQIIPVDVTLDLKIRNKYLKKYYASIGRIYQKIDELDIFENGLIETDKSARVYVAGSAFDKPLKESYKLASYEKLIQVGTSLSANRLDTDCYDDIGDNISHLNAQFCELTGLYWVWKNATEDIVGLVHYRRHFTVPNDWKIRMLQHSVDVILPLPLYVMPSVEGNYKNRHIGINWENMMKYLENNRPYDYEMASKFFASTSLYSPCNMFIMKRDVLNELCTWMFPILFAVADECGTIDDNYQNRYPGFISERLITYFFEKNRDKYKVVYADKNFLQ